MRGIDDCSFLKPVTEFGGLHFLGVFSLDVVIVVVVAVAIVEITRAIFIGGQKWK